MQYFLFFGLILIFCGLVISFPEDFIFSAASAAYQVEGAWNSDGKGESIWDRYVHQQPNSIKNRANGDIACDSYHHYKEDVNLLSHMGFQMYRFSISWTRILPTGSGETNKAGIDYYHNLINELLQKNIQPMVTIYHWDLPHQLQEIGGWTNPKIADLATEYADILFKEYGEKVKWWITINEPSLIAIGYTGSWLAPGLNRSWSHYVVGHNLLRAHAQIYRLYDKKYRATQNGKLSLSLPAVYHEPKTNNVEDISAAERAMTFSFDAYAHPIYSAEGDYPQLMKQRIAENSETEDEKLKLPVFTEAEIKSLKGSYDFFGINHYTSFLCTPKLNNFTSFYDKHKAAACHANSSLPASNNPHQTIDPLLFRKLLLWLKERYNVPIFITEHGWFGKEGIYDIEKIEYHRLYLKEILIAINDYNCSVIGYTVWSLTDSFEWNAGYEYKFGLAHIDFEDPQRKRTPKLSANFFKELNERRTIPDIANYKHTSSSANNKNLFR